ncbi:hypothetical protein DFH08DRAFT_803903 [Mycena albidolilacea]|uniref:Uncharacterized protein n=1 Tax=Mycena albidolilacea TaxID=1033008 RepID=A0AAD7EXZ7_9AGAR|nr:hypothetical protein DFH08DRAFT_803903 [Mycena albidolilacea]
MKHLSSFFPTFLLQACLILITICHCCASTHSRKLQDHSLMLLVLQTTSFMWPDDVGDQYGPSFIIYHRLNPHPCAADSTISYGGDDPDSKFQCLLGHVKHLRRRQFGMSQWLPAFQMTWLGRISNTTSYVYHATPEPHTMLMPCYYEVTHAQRDRINGYVSYPYQGALSSMGCYIKCCIHYHKTLDFQKLCKTHAYGVQVDQGEQTACKNHTFTSVPSTASSLYPVLHPVTDIDFNQQRSKWR